jgi:hypothetical protein
MGQSILVRRGRLRLVCITFHQLSILCVYTMKGQKKLKSGHVEGDGGKNIFVNDSPALTHECIFSTDDLRSDIRFAPGCEAPRPRTKCPV